MKVLLKLLLMVAGMTALAYFIPVIAWNISSDSIEGLYYSNERCSCGKFLFWEVENDRIYATCPGHGERKSRYTLKTVNDHWQAVGTFDGKLCFEIQKDGNTLRISTMANGGSTTWNRLQNPWRIWLPKLFT